MLGSQGVNSGQPADLLISGTPVACSNSQRKSAELETGLLISAVVAAAVILALGDGEVRAAEQKALAHPWELQQGSDSDGRCFLCDRYSRALKRNS